MSNEKPIGLRTLKDVAHVLPTVYSKTSAKTLTAALKKAERLTGLQLSQIPADENDWIRRTQSMVWAGEFRGATPGDQEAAFETWVKKIASTIRRAQQSMSAPVKMAEQSGAWDQIVEYAEDVENRFDEDGMRILPNMFSAAMASLRSRCGHLHPTELTTETARQALFACRVDKTSSFRNAIAAFNRLVREQNQHPAVAHLLPNLPIGPIPHLRDAPLDWGAFTPAFIASRDRNQKMRVQDKYLRALDPAARTGRREMRDLSPSPLRQMLISGWCLELTRPVDLRISAGSSWEWSGT